MNWSVCLLKSVAKFKDAISLMVLKDVANGFHKMSLCSSFRREIELLLEGQLKNPKNLISGGIMQKLRIKCPIGKSNKRE